MSVIIHFDRINQAIKDGRITYAQCRNFVQDLRCCSSVTGVMQPGIDRVSSIDLSLCTAARVAQGLPPLTVAMNDSSPFSTIKGDPIPELCTQCAVFVYAFRKISQPIFPK